MFASGPCSCIDMLYMSSWRSSGLTSLASGLILRRPFSAGTRALLNPLALLEDLDTLLLLVLEAFERELALSLALEEVDIVLLVGLAVEAEETVLLGFEAVLCLLLVFDTEDGAASIALRSETLITAALLRVAVEAFEDAFETAEPLTFSSA